jgi:DNA mismatch repair protein MutS2
MNNIINIRKMRLPEALLKLERELDEIYLSGYKKVIIIHGKGKGKLKEMVHNFLNKQFYVKDFRVGEFYEGGDGVTIVNLDYSIEDNKNYFLENLKKGQISSSKIFLKKI